VEVASPIANAYHEGYAMNALGDLPRVSRALRKGQQLQGMIRDKREALALLLEAYHFAQEVNRNVWEFAVEASLLRAFGLTVNDFRWLVCKGYVEHAREVTRLGEMGRQFRANGELVFSKRTCFVLTEAGVEFLCREDPAMQLASLAAPEPTPKIMASSEHVNGAALHKPTWDCDRRELRFVGSLVKQFKLPSPNQEHILMAFEEDGWPPRIDDPLPPHPEAEPKQRLRETIRSLNRNQKERLVRFKGDGTGEGVLWEPFAEETSGAGRP
jgi:hypothetical protein